MSSHLGKVWSHVSTRLCDLLIRVPPTLLCSIVVSITVPKVYLTSPGTSNIYFPNSGNFKHTNSFSF